MDRVRDVGGLGFEDVKASPARLPSFGAYLPQFDDHFKDLAGCLDAPIYGVRVSSVWRGGTVLPAEQVRQTLAMKPEQRLVLLLFDQDEMLEELWRSRMPFEIAAAQYSMVVAPSYSTWRPRPALEGLYNLRRSQLFFAALQLAGVPAIPRVGWQTPGDVTRMADWVSANPAIQMVGLDIQTYGSSRDFRDVVAGLAAFDRATGACLSYLINGPTVAARVACLFKAVAPDRVHLTNATTSVGLRPDRQSRSPLLSMTRRDRFPLQVRRQEGMLRAAAEQATAGASLLAA